METRGWGTFCSSDDIVAVEQGTGWPIIGRLPHFSCVCPTKLMVLPSTPQAQAQAQSNDPEINPR